MKTNLWHVTRSHLFPKTWLTHDSKKSPNPWLMTLNSEHWRILHWNENKHGFGAVFIRPLFGVWRCRSSEQQSRGGDWPISQNFALIPCKAHWVTALWLQWLQWLYPSRAKSRKQYRTRSCFHSRFKSWKMIQKSYFTLEWKQQRIRYCFLDFAREGCSYCSDSVVTVCFAV